MNESNDEKLNVDVVKEKLLKQIKCTIRKWYTIHVLSIQIVQAV